MTEEIDWQRVADAVAFRRRELGFTTQEEAAVAAGVGVQTWRQIEGAKQTSYRRPTLAAIALALDWPSNMLIRIGQGEDPPATTDAAWQARIEASVEELHAAIRAVHDAVRSIGPPNNGDTPPEEPR